MKLFRGEHIVHRVSTQALIALILVATLTNGMAANPAVGIVTANGNFNINQAKMAGNATLFDGNVIETGNAASQLNLNNGTRLELAAGSKGTIHTDRLVLERGGIVGNHNVEAATLWVRPTASSKARVSLRDGNLVQVAALTGPVSVLSSNGVLLANVAAGSALSFTPDEAGAAAPSTLTGCIAGAGGKFHLVDETSSVRFELMGGAADKHVGHRVQVTGTVNPASADSNAVRVSTLKMLSKKCGNKGAVAAGAAGAAGGAAAGGVSGAAAGAAAAGAAGAAVTGISTAAVIAGVVVTGAAAGTALAVVAKDPEPEPDTISPSTR
ncbi:MAG: hypothetical protein ACRD96_08530 [Bryobacteraceae bacterium]